MALRDQRSVPAGTVLLVERDQLPVPDPSLTPSLDQHHQAEQPGHLGLVGELPAQGPRQPDRLRRELRANRVTVAGGEVALVEDEEQDRQHTTEPLGEVGDLGHAVRLARAALPPSVPLKQMVSQTAGVARLIDSIHRGDLEALARDTHKFEAHYLDSLIGPYPQAKEIYQTRSPIHHVEQLNCPVIFLQGLQDKVVPPEQAEAMVSALKAKGIYTEYVTFAEEGHGFRQAQNIQRALEAELRFYLNVFDQDFGGV